MPPIAEQKARGCYRSLSSAIFFPFPGRITNWFRQDSSRCAFSVAWYSIHHGVHHWDLAFASTETFHHNGRQFTAEDAGIPDVVWQEVAQPVDTIACSPCFLVVAVEAMDGDDARWNAMLVGYINSLGKRQLTQLQDPQELKLEPTTCYTECISASYRELVTS